jgi:hypothetical protein
LEEILECTVNRKEDRRVKPIAGAAPYAPIITLVLNFPHWLRQSRGEVLTWERIDR